MSKSLFVTSSKSKKLERILITDQKKLNQLHGFDLFSGNVTSVDIHKNLIATSIKSEMIGFKGMVKIFNIEGKEVANYEVGFSPDNLSFSPDGSFILTANEGEPNDDYSIDPEGSFTLIDISNDLVNGVLTEISFKNQDKPKKFRIVRPNASLASDVEPEYITFSPDGKKAYATLQENNAIATIDISLKKILSVRGLGTKDVSKVKPDFSDMNDGIVMRKWPVLMMYQPDTILSYNINDVTYLVTANEGDSRKYEEIRVKDLEINSELYKNFNYLKKNENLGRLKTTKIKDFGDTKKENDLILSFGGRSFSIWKDDYTLVYDSGNDFENIISKYYPNHFNSDTSMGVDNRSDDRDPEPEALALGKIDNRYFAFIGMERGSAIFTYNITDPYNSHFVNVIMPSSIHNSPESIEFINAKESPSGNPMLAIAFEKSGTIGLFEIENF